MATALMLRECGQLLLISEMLAAMRPEACGPMLRSMSKISSDEAPGRVARGFAMAR